MTMTRRRQKLKLRNLTKRRNRLKKEDSDKRDEAIKKMLAEGKSWWKISKLLKCNYSVIERVERVVKKATKAKTLETLGTAKAKAPDAKAKASPTWFAIYSRDEDVVIEEYREQSKALAVATDKRAAGMRVRLAREVPFHVETHGVLDE